MKPTFIQKLKVAIFGYTFIHKRILREGAESTPFYIAKCRIHGYFSDYPHKFKAEIRCPMCKEVED